MIKMKPLLKESTWADRKFGEPLPTLEDYVTEADDDKYVSVGWGKYKEKGKEDDENAPTFSKTDSGQFVKAADDKKGDADAPEKEPAGKLGGGDFERDFDDEKPEDEPSNDIEYHEYEEIRSPLEIEDFLERHGDKLSDEQKDKIHDLGLDLEDAEGEMAMGQISDDEYEEKVSDIQGEISDVVDTTAGDPGDSWDDEEGRAKPTGKTDADTDDDPVVFKGIGGVLSSMSADDAKNAPKDSPQYKAWAKKHPQVVGMDKASDLAKKGMEKGKEKRPGGEQAELDYQKADEKMRKWAGVDIKKAEFWAKQKRIAADKMMGEITIDGKKYKPITESIKPTIYDPHREIKKAWNKISLRQFDRKWIKK